jgi:hypothetical protein
MTDTSPINRAHLENKNEFDSKTSKSLKKNGRPKTITPLKINGKGFLANVLLLGITSNIIEGIKSQKTQKDGPLKHRQLSVLFYFITQ